MLDVLVVAVRPGQASFRGTCYGSGSICGDEAEEEHGHVGYEKDRHSRLRWSSVVDTVRRVTVEERSR